VNCPRCSYCVCFCVGSNGARGATGATGAAGGPGVGGAVGDTGAPGSAGVEGPTGQQGSMGPRGDRGVIGVVGLPGTQGQTSTVQGTPKVVPQNYAFLNNYSYYTKLYTLVTYSLSRVSREFYRSMHRIVKMTLLF